MKAIETEYSGVKFRSRLEARWAVFFDALGIKWQYEPEGFELRDGTRYVPDFSLVAPFYARDHAVGHLFAEVKPTGGDFSKSVVFAAEIAEEKMYILALEGEPGRAITKEEKACRRVMFPGVCFGLQPAWTVALECFDGPGNPREKGSIAHRDLSALYFRAAQRACAHRFWNPGVVW